MPKERRAYAERYFHMVERGITISNPFSVGYMRKLELKSLRNCHFVHSLLFSAGKISYL
jgi:hypothetical protein